jgi:GNAT superfamily N-acetyltransferase
MVEEEQHSRTFFVAEVDELAVGMANVKRYDRMPIAGRPRGGWWGYVGNVFVLPDYRNTGVGGDLMDDLIAWAFAAGAEHLRLAPSPLSVPFYDRLGFAPGSDVELDPPTSWTEQAWRPARKRVPYPESGSSTSCTCRSRRESLVSNRVRWNAPHP